MCCDDSETELRSTLSDHQEQDAARKKPIGELEVGEIPESSMEVVKVYAPAKRQAGVKIKAESPEESVAQAMKLIADAKVL